MGLILRTTKGTPLTYQEMDGNLTYLEGMSGGPSGSAFTGSFSGSFTGSYFGTASYAISASWAPGGGSIFPYTGSALITGSLGVTGSLKIIDGGNIPNFHISRSINGFLYEAKIENYNDGVSAASSLLISSNIGKMEFGQLSSTHTTYTVYGQTGDTFIRSGVGSRNLNILTDPNNTGKILFFSRLNPTTDSTIPSFAIDGLRSGFGTLPFSNSALSIKGSTSGSSNYSLQIQNSAGSSSLYVRDDGFVTISGNVEVTGSITGSFTGSLQGSSSYALTASYAPSITQELSISGTLSSDTVNLLDTIPVTFLSAQGSNTIIIITGAICVRKAGTAYTTAGQLRLRYSSSGTSCLTIMDNTGLIGTSDYTYVNYAVNDAFSGTDINDNIQFTCTDTISGGTGGLYYKIDYKIIDFN